MLKLLPEVGDIKKVTIRENRYPFLSKVGEWNKDTEKSGDTLVEKCCHFFDLFRLIVGKEMSSCVSKGN
jgi:myo-inositol 2-dehydrogenase/D-chiro-inositol 1-dehydrogenase